MDVTVSIKGMAELEARLLEIDGLGSQKVLQRVLRKVAKPLMLRARGNASTVGRSQALALSIGIMTRKTSQAGTRARTRAKAAGRGNVVARVSVGSIAKNRMAVSRYNQFYNKNGMYRRKGIFYGWMLDQGHRVGTSKTGWLRKYNIESRAMTAKGLARYARKLAGGRLKTRTRTTGGGDLVAARPWWTPAVNASEMQAINDFPKILDAALRKIEKRKSKTANPDSVVTE
jgi:hypothetical protein